MAWLSSDQSTYEKIMFCFVNALSLLNSRLCRPGVEAGSRIVEQKDVKCHYAYTHTLTTTLNSS